MRLKLRFVLPVVQMLVAVALLVWTDRWERALMRIMDMPGTPPSFTLLIAINAPLATPRALVYRYLPGWWDQITLVVVIGVFWYWVSLNIESWQQKRRLFIFSWVPLRLVADAIAVAIGVMWVFMLWGAHWYTVPRYTVPPGVSIVRGWSLSQWLRFVPCSFLPVLWSATLIFFFGRDILHCVLHYRNKAKSTASD